MAAIDDYLEGLPSAQKAALRHVCEVVERAAPEAEQGKSYGLPAFLFAGRPLLGMQAAKKHLSIFPFSPAAIEHVKGRLEGFDVAKGTIRFSPDRPVPGRRPDGPRTATHSGDRLTAASQNVEWVRRSR